MKAAKQEWVAKQCKDIEKGAMSRSSKVAYNTLKALNKTQQRKSAGTDDSSGNILTESTTVLNRWTEYYSGLHSYGLHPDTSPLQSNQTPAQEPESLPVLREAVEQAVYSLKTGKSPGVDSIAPELLKNGGNSNIPNSDMPEDLRDEEMAEEVDTITHHTFTEEMQPQATS